MGKGRGNEEGWQTIVAIFQVFVMLISAVTALFVLMSGGKRKAEAALGYDEARYRYNEAVRKRAAASDEWHGAWEAWQRYQGSLGYDRWAGSPTRAAPTPGTRQALAKARLVEAGRKLDAALDAEEEAFNDAAAFSKVGGQIGR
ncbi:MAG: hypothetical protein OXI12_09185 [Gammaproteobacteria bacterium]|nr:hypothetical protein [Gammaproteobacteria bacterium]